MDGATLSFLAAKLLGFLLNPYSLFIAGLGLSFILLMTTRKLRAGRYLLTLVLGCYVVFGMFPIGTWAINQLEDRFPMAKDHPAPIAGILVLGGSVSTVMTRERGQVSVGGNIERLTEFVRLSQRHPEAKLAYIGGQGRVFDRKPTEAEVSKRFLDEIGMDTSTVWFEDKSRNTEEGAYVSYAHLQPGDAPWVLITSASHMPRAVGLFRKAGWSIMAHPVDYGTLPGGHISWTPKWPGSLGPLNAAIYEWAGLVFAWTRGKIDDVFPGPITVTSTN
ncbi:MAG: YdcF family protein [Magnetovibrio sp.]|nr:YdcF family protein [Magnetovibrio sp.]